MKCSAIIVPALAGLAAAIPVTFLKRQASNISDVDILQFALTLENLEAAFYARGLQVFAEEIFIESGFSSQFYQDLVAVSQEEDTHVQFLQGAISGAGASPVAPCAYSFPVSDLASFISVSALLEGVGVSAYLGAAASIQNPDTLTAAASIMTVEARHSAFVNALLNKSPFPEPFDDPLSPNQVFSLASAFITSCPSTNAPLPFAAFPPLQLGSQGSITVDVTITINTPSGMNLNNGQQVFAAFITGSGPIYVAVTVVAGGVTVVIPAGVAGQTYIVLTSSNSGKVSDASTLAGPLIIQVDA